MTTPQNPGVRRKQKARRTKQLAQWRAKNGQRPDARGQAAIRPHLESEKGAG